MSHAIEIRTPKRRSTAVVCVSLPPVMVEQLDAQAARRFTTRTQVVRDLILRQLEEELTAEQAAAAAVIEGEPKEPHAI